MFWEPCNSVPDNHASLHLKKNMSTLAYIPVYSENAYEEWKHRNL